MAASSRREGVPGAKPQTCPACGEHLPSKAALTRHRQAEHPRTAKNSRNKGLQGEAEVGHVWKDAGAAVRGLESEGDHLVVCAKGLTIHSEVKRAERLKIPEWWRQTVDEAPRGTVPVLHHRQNRGEWLVTLRLDDLAVLVTT